MTALKKLDGIRAKKVPQPACRIALQIFVATLLGAAVGVLVKLFDLLPYQYEWSPVLSRILEGMGMVGSLFSLWTFACTLFAVFSPSPLLAGVRCFCFLVSMDAAYYLCQSAYYGLDSRPQFFFWGVLAFLSFPCGAAVWYARGSSLLSAALTAFPVSVCLTEAFVMLLEIISQAAGGASFFMLDRLVVFVFSAVCTVLLLLICQRGWRRRLQTVAFCLLLTIVLALLLLFFG